MELSKLQAEFAALEANSTLLRETNLYAREKALDYIGFIGEIAAMHKDDAGLAGLYAQALGLQTRLTAINTQLFTRLRAKIQAGAYTRQALRQEFQLFTAYAPIDQGQAHIGYDGLDSLIGGLFEIDPPPQATQTLSPEMVHYEPTPARAILDLIDHVDFAPTDLFYDLGSGLGYVAMLVNLLTGVQTKGVELEPAFCVYAQSTARRFGLTSIEFINADARQADYRDGTVFYLFTPFRGALLQSVLAKLANEARVRPIKICTYGPCTLSVAQQPWLRSLDANADHEFKLAIFEGRP